MVERGRERRGAGETERRGERKEREHFVCFLFKPVQFHWTRKALGTFLATSVHTCLSRIHCTRCVYPFNLAMRVEGSRWTVCVDISGFCAVF